MTCGEHSLKISSPCRVLRFTIWLLQFGWESDLKIRRKRMIRWINYLMSDKGVCRTAPVTPCLLIMGIKTKIKFIDQGYSNITNLIGYGWFRPLIPKCLCLLGIPLTLGYTGEVSLHQSTVYILHFQVLYTLYTV